MKVTVLEDANLRHAQLGWELSRDSAQDYDIEAIKKVDAPVMELPSYLLLFEDFTILEREIFATPRNHVMWARTSRVDDPLLFTVPPALKSLAHEIYRKQMLEEKAKGATQDTWRYNLPLVANTAWTMRISVRDLNRMQSTFSYLATRAADPLAARFADVAACLAKYVGQHKPKGGMLCEGNHTSNLANVRIGEMKFIRAKVPIALRAQLVRHRDIIFADDLFNRVICSDQGVFMQLHDTVTMELCATDAVWDRVLSHRACWIAQADLWEPITRKFGGALLPCKDGTCPFAVDAEARLTVGNDPNPPCPRYMNLHQLDKSSWRAPMLEAATRRSEFWVNEVNK